MPVERHLEWLNAYICFRLLSSLRNLSFSRNCHVVTCTISGTCHHETDSGRVNWLNKFVSNIGWMNRVRHGSSGVQTSTARTMSCGSLLILLFFLMSDVICPVGGTYNHVHIFLCSRMKKAFKLASRASFGIAKWFYLFQIDQLPVEPVNSARISLVVTCTADCTCHHLKIPAKN